MKRYCPSICKTVDAEMGTYTLSILDDIIATVINCRVASINPSAIILFTHTTHKYGRRTEKNQRIIIRTEKKNGRHSMVAQEHYTSRNSNRKRT